MSKMKNIASANQKGGVGKTTLARHLVFWAIERGLKVLCVDLDPQRNFTKTIRAIRENNLGDGGEAVEASNASHLFFEDASVVPLNCGRGVGLLSGDRELVDVAGLPLQSMFTPREKLAALADDYDVCIIDTSPTLGNPLYAALIAADFVVCPCAMDQDAIDGLGDLFEDISRVQQQGWNADLTNLGLLANKVNTRRAFDTSALQQLHAALGEAMLTNVLYDRAATQYAKERPVWKVQSGESQIRAAQEMRAVCTEIFTKAGFVF